MNDTDEIDDEDDFKRYLDRLRETLPLVEYERQERVCLPLMTFADTNWAAKELGDMLTTLHQTHHIPRFRELRLSLAYLRSGYDVLLSFLRCASIGTLILDGYNGQFGMLEDLWSDYTSITATDFLRVIASSCDVNEIIMQGIITVVPADVLANVLARRTLSFLHLDELNYTSAAAIATLSNAFRDNVGLRVLHLDVSPEKSNTCISQILRNLPATLQKLIVELPICYTYTQQPIVSALSELLAKESLQVLHLRHFVFRDLSWDGLDFCRLPRLSLEFCGFETNSSESFAQAACKVHKLCMHGTQFGDSNHLLYHTLSNLPQLEILHLGAVRYPNLSPIGLFRSFNKSSLRSLEIVPSALRILLPHVGLLERLESLEILGELQSTPFSMEDVRQGLRRNRSLLVITVNGRPAFEGLCRRNRGLLRTNNMVSMMHLLPLALQQVAPCHDAATWTARALLLAWNDTTESSSSSTPSRNDLP